MAKFAFQQPTAEEVSDYEFHAEPYDEVIRAMIDLYARYPFDYDAERSRHARQVYLAQIRKIAEDPDTPLITLDDALQFLAAPEDWPCVRHARAHGHSCYCDYEAELSFRLGK